MKMFDRVLLGVYSLSLVILFLIVGLVALGWTSPVNMLQQALGQQDQRMAIALLAIVYIVVSLKFLIGSVGTREVLPQALVRDSSLGQVRITVQALENLVRKTVLQVRGIREVKPRIVAHPEGIGVFVHVIVAPDVIIPEASNEVQEKVKEHLEQIAGVGIHSVKVLVDNIATDSKARDKVS